MRRQARLDSAQAWVGTRRAGHRGTYAKRYGVDRYTAYEELTAIGFPLPATDRPKCRAKRAGPAKTRRSLGSDWVWVGERRMFVVGHTAGGAPFGLWEDEVEDWP